MFRTAILRVRIEETKIVSIKNQKRLFELLLLGLVVSAVLMGCHQSWADKKMDAPSEAPMTAAAALQHLNDPEGPKTPADYIVLLQQTTIGSGIYNADATSRKFMEELTARFSEKATSPFEAMAFISDTPPWWRSCAGEKILVDGSVRWESEQQIDLFIGTVGESLNAVINGRPCVGNMREARETAAGVFRGRMLRLALH